MRVDLSGKTILVTGASGGIGEAVSRCLGGAGARVAVHYNSAEERARKLAGEIGNGSEPFQADLSRPENAFALFDSVIEKMGTLDVLVNNAGVYHRSPVGLGGEKWLEDWNFTLNLNLTSAALLSKKAINHFMERGGGRIVHIASRAAFRGETADYLAYGASKGGLVSLSRAIARSFGVHGIKSFVIAPGLVKTKMIEELMEGRSEEELVGTEIALPRMTRPEDIAPTVALMASGMMDHATGCVVDMNAGSYMR